MYYEFESIPTAMESMSLSAISPMSGLSRRHRRLSSSSQSLRELIDNENVIENITPSHCDLYLITRKKLSQINTNTVKQSPDLRREVLLASIHRNITSKSPVSTTMNALEVNDLMTSSPSVTPDAIDKSVPNDSPMITNSDQQFKFVNLSATTSTSTTTMANTNSSARMMTTTSTRTTPSAIKKRNLAPTPLPNNDYEEEWKTTIKRLKVVHGLDGCPHDVSMDSEFDSGFCDNDLNDLTTNFHSLKTPFA